MYITFNLFDWALLFIIIILIWRILPDDYIEEIGCIVGCIIEIV